MATAVRRSNTDGIAQCSMSRATPEATGCRHWATTCSVSPQQPPGQQANKQQSTNTPKKLAVLMAMAMHRYVTVHIAWWRRLRALLDATKRHHRASIAANSCNRSCMCQFFMSFFVVNLYKKVAGFAGSRRVLATTVDDWLENLFVLAPVRAYAYVQKYHNLIVTALLPIRSKHSVLQYLGLAAYHHWNAPTNSLDWAFILSLTQWSSLHRPSVQRKILPPPSR